MTQPTAYTRQADFSDFESSNPTDPKSGTSLDAEFDAIKVTTDQIRTNLAILQRDDTKLGNLTVHVEALDTAARALLTTEAGTIRGAWVTATAYAVKDVVTESGTTYICAVAHTSGTFATDLTAAKWLAISTPDSAADVSYDNSTSSLAATDVQAALDEIDGDLDAHIAATSSVHGITAAAATLLDDTTIAAMLTTLGLPAMSLVSGTDYLKVRRISGDVWILFNADYNTGGSYFERIDEEKYSFALTFYYNAVPGESDQGIVFWRAVPSLVSGSPNPDFTAESPTKKIKTTFGATGGWELMFDLTQFRDIVLGSYGIEVDGAGTVPYVRYMHGVTYSSKIYSGIVYNALVDFSGTDRTNRPSWFVGGRVDSATGLVNEFVVMWAPANTPGGASEPDSTTPTFSDIIAVTLNSGTTAYTNQGWLRKGTVLEKNPIAVNSQTTQAHGLGAVPDIVVSELVCVTGELGYSAGDRIDLGSGIHAVNGATTVASVFKDSTNLILTISNNSLPSVARKDTNAAATITAANWKVTLTPYTFV